MTNASPGESLYQRIEQALEEAGLFVAVEEVGGVLRLEGRVDTPEARQAATDVVRAVAPTMPVENNLEVEVVWPPAATDDDADTREMSALPDGVEDLREAGGELEPDFTSQELETSPVEMAGEASATDDPIEEGETVYFPPTDPVITLDERGEVAVLGGFAPTSMDEVAVERSALDGEIGDEAIADAVRRELREDALTTDLVIAVRVRRGVVRLRGVVATLDDAESAEEVASRVPGVREVIEELEVAGT